MDPAFESGQREGRQVSAGTAPDDLPAVVLETLFGVLADDCRREALQCLAARDRTIPLDELAAAVEDGDAASSSTNIPLTLHHRHLPALADEGLVSYDTEANLVTVTERGRQLAPFVTAYTQQAE